MSQYRGILFIVLGTLLFSSKAIVVKYLYQYDVPPLTLQSWRMIIVFPFYLGILMWSVYRGGRQIQSWRDLLAILAVGIACYHIASWLDLVGLLYISAGLERVILFCYPAIAMLFGWWLLDEKPTKRLFSALLLSYAGIFLFFQADLKAGGSHIILGSVLVFLASILTAWFMVANQKFSRLYGSQRFTCLAMLGASASLMIHVLIKGDVPLLDQAQPVYWGSATIAIFCTLIPSFLISLGIKEIGASRAAIIGTIGPLATVFFSNWLLGEPLTFLHIGGLLLVIWGMSRVKS